MPIDKRILEYANDEQAKKIQALIDTGSERKAAEIVGTSRASVRSAVSRATAKMVQAGEFPAQQPVDGILTDTSDLYNVATGKHMLRWVKNKATHEQRIAAMRALIDSMKDEIPRATPVPFASTTSDASLLTQYTLTDYHLGMLAWGEEAGHDWDLKIAEELLVKWFSAAVSMSPNSKTAILAQLGDLLHYDSLDSVTPTNRHQLDADTRPQKMIRVAIRVIRRVIDMLLTKHEKVIVVMAEGNHDLYSSAWLRETFAALYELEPRIEVDTSPLPYYCYEHGLTSLFYHHGHLRNPGEIDRVVVAQFREVFGRTKYSYAHLGHQHHEKTFESQLMKVVQHPTLAPRDAHSARGGYAAQRAAKAITYSDKFGFVSEMQITPEMVMGV